MEYRGYTLDHFQAQAIDAINQGRSVLVSAPTGTGKTLIADFLIDQVVKDGGDIIYTAPIKALSNQKYREYTRLFGKERVGLVTGDIVINRDAQIRIMTTEILRNMLLQGNPTIDEHLEDDEREEFLDTAPGSHSALPELDRLKAVIIDEIHFIDDPERGTVWEELLIYLPQSVRILGLSATLSNLEVFADWLSQIRGEEIAVVKEFKRTVPLDFFLTNKSTHLLEDDAFNKAFKKWSKSEAGNKSKSRGRDSGRGSRGRGGDRSTHLDVFDQLDATQYPVLFFIYSRKLTEQYAFDLARSDTGRAIGRRSKRDEIDEHLNTFSENFPGVMTSALRGLLSKGIAFHHAGLHVGLKALVEGLYEARLIQVLYCTSTFALGINMPARSVVFDSLTKFNGVDIVPLSVREFMQMAGRAGRRGIDAAGDVIMKVDFQDYLEIQPTLRMLLDGKSEPVTSSFNLSFNSVVSLIDRYSEDQIRTLLERSFMAFQSAGKVEELQTQLASARKSLAKVVDPNRQERRKVAYLERQSAEAQRPQLWENFQRKLSFLRSHGYLGANNELQSAARILKKIQFEEIFITELMLAGVIEDLSGEELFGVMCGLVQTLPRAARVSKPDDDKWWDIFDQIRAVFESGIVVDAQRIVSTEYTFTPQLMFLGESWANGAPLAELLGHISNPTDLSGDLVGAFRRAKDLVGQIRDVYEDDAERRRELTHVLRAVTRDEVEVID
jgi:superfamily II RNA helicase